MIRDAVVFPDAAAATLSHLRDVFGWDVDDHRTGTHPPDDRKVGDGPLIVARRVGGTAEGIVIDNASVVFEFWHDTEDEAHDLAQLGRAHLLALWGSSIDGVLIYGVTEFGGPASDPDPLQRSPRFTATYSVAVRGSTLVESA